MDYSPWSSKNLIDRNRPKKFMHVGIDVKCMHTNFGGRNLSSFWDIATFKNGQISLTPMTSVRFRLFASILYLIEQLNNESLGDEQ